MMRAKRSLLASALATAMILAALMPNAALAQDSSIAVDKRPGEIAMMFDVIAARPLLLASTVIGTGLFIVSLPFSSLGGNVSEAGNALVMVPAKSTLIRCLGCTPAQHDRRAAERAVEKKNKEASDSN